jgi:L-asparaginase / beta-aspartyl-peptidase
MAPSTPRAPARALPVAPFDAHLAARTLLLAVGLGALVLAVGAATDEQSALWSDRLVRLGALAPAWAGAAFAIAKGQARRRGEARALALLGVGPLRLWAGAWLAASSLGVAFAAALLHRAAPLRSLFPALEPSPWRPAGGGFEAPRLGLNWTPPAEHFAFTTPLEGAAAGPPRLWLVAALVALAPLVPLWLALPGRTLERLALGAAAVASALFTFHLVAGGGSGAFLLAAPALLAADALRLDLRARAQPFGLRRPPRAKPFGVRRAPRAQPFGRTPYAPYATLRATLRDVSDANTISASWSGGRKGAAWGLLVHGGAGDVPLAKRDDHAEGCRRALARAAALLAGGGSALDAVQAAVLTLEDDARFNAGTGASLNEAGEPRFDASIMGGERLAFGAVCDLPAFRNPIAVARAVLDDGRHVLYAADGASRFALAKGFSAADPASMITDAARERLAARRRGGSANWAGGTVGAVAFDAAGHVAAATSTGGLVGKAHGRVGDSPVPGAGTYADDAGCAVSGTGEGEGYLRYGLALRVSLLVGAGAEGEGALRAGLSSMFAKVGASGGAIVATPAGGLAWARTTPTMSWAAHWQGADPVAGV